MKSPEDIKKGLECCNTFNDCQECPYDKADGSWACTVERNADALAYIQQLEANQIKGRCKDCKHVVINTHNGIFKGEDMECGLIEAYECDASTTADGYCDRWEQKEDAHGSETGEKHEAQEMADAGPGEAGTEPV